MPFWPLFSAGWYLLLMFSRTWWFTKGKLLTINQNVNVQTCWRPYWWRCLIVLNLAENKSNPNFRGVVHRSIKSKRCRWACCTSTVTELCLRCPWPDLDFKACSAYCKLLIEVNCCSCRTVAEVFTFTRQDRNSWMAHCIQLIFWCVRIPVWQTYLNQGKNTLVRKP